MIILLFLIIQLIYLLRKSPSNKNLLLIVIASLCSSIGFSLILHFELMISNQETYGSDETVYYNSMLFASSIENWISYIKDDYNTSYVLYGTLILKTSWIKSVLIIRICNSFLLVNTILMIYRMLIENTSIKMNNILFSLWFISLNGMITWTAIRNLKDILFIYFLIIFIWLLIEFIRNKKTTLKNVIYILSSIYILTDIRQWFIYLLIILVGAMLIHYFVVKKLYIIVIFIAVSGLLLLVAFFQKGYAILMIYTTTYTEFSSGGVLSDFTAGSILNIPIAMGRFILGPGPIRAIFGSESFLSYTTTGNVLITLGSLLWWFFIPLFILAITSIKNIKENYLVFIVIMFYWIMYSYAYSGSGDTRLRAVFYILCILITLPYINNKGKSLNLRYIIILIPIILAGTYFSYVSLS